MKVLSEPFSLISWSEINFFNDAYSAIKDKKYFLSVSVGAAAIATFLWLRFKNNEDRFPVLPNAHWLKGHMDKHNASKSTGRLLQSMNEGTNYDVAYFRSVFGGNHRLILYTLKDLKEMFYVRGQQTIGRKFGVSLHRGSKSKDAILDTSGPRWKNNRRVFHNHLRNVGRDKQLEYVLDEAYHLTDTLEQMPEDFEPTALFQSAVCNVISVLIFGSRFEYFNDEAENIFKSIFRANGKLFHLPDYVIAFLTYFSLSKKISGRIQSVKTCKDYIRKQIDDRVRAGIREPAETLIDAYIADLSRSGLKCDAENLVAVIYELFFAGTETTSTTLNWLLACLSTHPDVQEKMFNEIQSQLGDSKPKIQHMRDLHYTMAVQHEIQRFGAIAQTTLPHRMVEDVKLPCGKVVKKNEFLAGNLYQIMRDPAHFKYPNEFNPENFLNDQGEFEQNEAFVPYGIGPRICLGQNLADLEIKIFLIELVRKFKISSKDDVDIHKSVQKLTCSPATYKYNFTLR